MKIEILGGDGHWETETAEMTETRTDAQWKTRFMESYGLVWVETKRREGNKAQTADHTELPTIHHTEVRTIDVRLMRLVMC